MKKRVLKKWVKNILIIINFIGIIIMTSDCENTTIFLLSHLIALIIIIFNSIILIKYDNY